MSIRVAIVGVGNCAKSLVEGLAFYRQYPQETIGLLRPKIGPYTVADIDIVAAFDVDCRKVSKSLNEALVAEPNNSLPLASIPPSSVIVQRGPSLDSVIPELTDYYIHETPVEPVDISAALKSAGAEILINYLPSGSQRAAEHYAVAACEAGCNFINCMSASLATNSELAKHFMNAGLVLLGDDIKSQCGATILNRTLLHLCSIRGVHVDSSVQLNYGGNADHFNLHFRPTQKELCKKDAVDSALGKSRCEPEIHMIYDKATFDHKYALIRLQGKIFGNAPVTLELSLHDEDSPNSAGVVVDAIRAAKILCINNKNYLTNEICGSLMKSAPIQMPEDEGFCRFENAILQALKP
jgi:myo-inositol-1-phosphate synthase